MRKFNYLYEILLIALLVILANFVYGPAINSLALGLAGCILFLVAINKLIEKLFSIKIEQY